MSEQTLIYVYHDGGVGVYMKPDGDLVWKVAGAACTAARRGRGTRLPTARGTAAVTPPPTQRQPVKATGCLASHFRTRYTGGDD